MPECKTCIHSKVNNATRTWCIYSPASSVPPADCGTGEYRRYESIYTIEPTIVLASRYYAPQTNDEQIVIAPMVLSIEEEEE